MISTLKSLFQPNLFGNFLPEFLRVSLPLALSLVSFYVFNFFDLVLGLNWLFSTKQSGLFLLIAICFYFIYQHKNRLLSFTPALPRLLNKGAH